MKDKKTIDHEGESFLVSDPNVNLDYEALVRDPLEDLLKEPLVIPDAIERSPIIATQGFPLILKFLISGENNKIAMEMSCELLSFEQYTCSSAAIKLVTSVSLTDALEFNTAHNDGVLDRASIYSSPSLWQGKHLMSRLSIKDIKKSTCQLEIDFI